MVGLTVEGMTSVEWTAGFLGRRWRGHIKCNFGALERRSWLGLIFQET